VTEVVAVRVTLELGVTTQSVTVAGETPLVDTVTNTQGQVVNSATIEELVWRHRPSAAAPDSW
jgi:hypothetical protein